ncbi:type VI secretion system protein ImpH [Bryocella elongata]|uniref:Type VI secretion system protein ImpH n=1 Tax=Bryocella elongata TaxID=863522 RepID=A0A1H6ADN0_9BACT|nr:type VI secretion system baseplate subunit TssG [Bryocella elongata]SEG46390.1 type VI secretion system protein ImpH [Bryocella elongata]
METTVGTTDVVVIDPSEPPAWQRDPFGTLREMLQEQGFLFEFFQAVRLLQLMHPAQKPVGYFHSPNHEVLRFSSVSTLAFPPSQLATVEKDEHGQYHMRVHFMGLTATISVMPDAYVEHMLRIQREGDKATAEFFDIFNHRLISLFYRGWEKYRFYIGLESGRPDSLSPRLYDLLGLGTEGQRNRGVLPDEAYLSYAGLLARHVRSAESLRQILEDYFEVQVAVHQFAGTWRRLPEQDRSELNGTGQDSELLGVGTIIGEEVWDHHGRIRVTLGPMEFDRYVKFLPGNDAYLMLRDWIQFYSSGQYEAEIQLVLVAKDAPGVQLGVRGQDEPRLGLVSWLKTRPLAGDPGDAIFLLT